MIQILDIRALRQHLRIRGAGDHIDGAKELGMSQNYNTKQPQEDKHQYVR